jgi:hypothetical protein
MKKEEFLKYIDHFNNKRYDDAVSYFAPDITVEYYDNALDPTSPVRTLQGAQAFIENYKKLHENVVEVLEVRDYISDDEYLFVELWTEFHAFNDMEASPARPALKKGDTMIMTNFILYNLEGGKMKRIRIAHWRNHPPEEAKYKG